MNRRAIAAVVLLFTAALWPVQARPADKITDANESAAILSLKAISAAQASYRLTCGNGAYAPSLVVLAMPPGKVGDGFIDKSLGSSLKPEKAGFIFAVTAAAGSNKGPADCNGTPTVTNFYATAVPVSEKTGTRSFALNQNEVIWTLKGLKAPTMPFGPPAVQIKIK